MEGVETKVVVPGERLSTEEEFLPAENTFAESGNLYASMIGEPAVNSGQIHVSSKKSITKYKKGMLVSGVVVGDLKAVLFVDIDEMVIDGIRYVSIKDGKIPIPKPRDDMRGGMRRSPPKEMQRPAAMGDVILARIQFNDADSYSLSMRDSETGVVFTKCDRCGIPMVMNNGSVSCPSCEYRTRKRVSPLYGNFSGIIDTIKSSIDNIDSYLEAEEKRRAERRSRSPRSPRPPRRY